MGDRPLDVAPESALRLVQTAHRLQDQPGLTEELKEGAVSFERVVEESHLVASGANPELVARSRGWDLTGLRRMVARHQRLSGPDVRGPVPVTATHLGPKPPTNCGDNSPAPTVG
jgi:hypothetical protein